MTDDRVRQIVRAAVDRHLAGRAQALPEQSAHPSFALFVLPAGAEGGGAGLIEPAVACSHCGYCKSYGH